MTAIDTTLPSLTIVKAMPYRGVTQDWSNTYFFDGTMPASSGSWKTLADNVIAAEKAIYTSATEVTDAIGHEAGESVAVWSYDYAGGSGAIPGTFTLGSDLLQSGDTAGWLRWSTDRLTSKGKPIFLRNYYHPAICKASPNEDDLATDWVAELNSFGAQWVSGFVDGDSVSHSRGGPHGVIGLVEEAGTFATTRTLRRRGKRPS